MHLFMIRVAPIHLAVYTNVDCACFTIIVIKFTSLTYTVRALQMIRMVGFLHKLSTIDDVTKYRGIPVSRYLFRRYIIVGHFLISRIPTLHQSQKVKGQAHKVT